MNPILTKKRRSQLLKNPRTLYGTRLNYNAAMQQKYARALEKLVKEMTHETKNAIIKLFNTDYSKAFFADSKTLYAARTLKIQKLDKDCTRRVHLKTTQDDSLGSQSRILTNMLFNKFFKRFSSVAMGLAERMVKGQEKNSQATLHSSLKELSGGLSLKTSIVSPELNDVITASIAENVDLIKSIPEEYFKQITGSVMRSITSGEGIKELIPEIQKYEGMTYRRARLIALDQTRKAYNSINKQKMQALGIKKFEWLHSGGGQHPRKSHEMMSGKIFSFDNLLKEQAALGVPEADRGLPGYPPNCKCVMGPVIEFDDE